MFGKILMDGCILYCILSRCFSCPSALSLSKRLLPNNASVQTLLFTVAGNWHSSPIRIACFKAGKRRGINVSHSFNWAASSTTSSSSFLLVTFDELDTVQKIMEALSIQKSRMIRFEDVVGSFKQLNSLFSCSRHFNLNLPRVMIVFQCFTTLEFLEPDSPVLYKKTSLTSSPIFFRWNMLLKSSSISRIERILL
uniref:Uncharacterized protein n=1 Tax=Arundo donax TaxID=35708 RepID=A0A0A9CXV0_ARUDO